jgi:lipopolysaccharide biosynthesis glycosyltransferase
MGAAVVLTSALRRLPKEGKDVIAYVLDGGLREADWQKMEKSVREAHDSARLVRLRPEMAQFEGLPQDWGSSVMTYARLALPELVNEVRILYLDADMIVQADLSPFMTRDLMGKTIAAARDVITRTISGDHLPVEALGLNPEFDYFQAGFLAIDMELWKKEQVSERVLAYLKDYSDYTRYWDQSALNAILYERWLRIEEKWNSPAFWADQTKENTSLDDPIIHFVGPDKPWLRAHHKKPTAKLFFNELDQTAWRGWRPRLWRDLLKLSKYKIQKIIK